jgi:DNA repair protein RadD
MSKILKALQLLTIQDLEKLAGTTIVRAVKGAYQTNRERALAQLVIDRYGFNLLKQKEIRSAFIDVLSMSDANLACEALNFDLSKIESPHAFLNDRYSTSFGESKAAEFVSIFDLPATLIPPTVVDEREASVFVCGEYGVNLKSKGVLHSYQRRLKDSIREKINAGRRRVMAQMPTGAGKTVTALEVLVDYLRSPGFSGLVVWIVNSNELADQALESFENLWQLRGDRPTRAYRYFGGFSSNYKTCEPGVVFASFDTAWAALDSDDVLKRENFINLSKRAQLVVVDEAHTSMADTYSNVIAKLISFDAYLVGLSATPGRNDRYQTEALAGMYGQELVSVTNEYDEVVGDAISYLREAGYLSKIIFEELESGARLNQSDEGKICSELAENSERNEQILKQIEKAISLNQSTIVFACTKDHVLALVALCRARAIDVGFIIGEVYAVERQIILNRFRSGDLKILINHEILSTGIDLPNVDRLIITRPVGSAILYSQILGRALRGPKNGGNKTNIVVNINDNLTNYPSASHVYKAFKNNFNI